MRDLTLVGSFILIEQVSGCNSHLSNRDVDISGIGKSTNFNAMDSPTVKVLHIKLQGMSDTCIRATLLELVQHIQLS